MDDAPTIYSIGHSNLGFDAFLAQLGQAGIEAIADIRSSPWSRFNPQFNRETLKASLKAAGIAYLHLAELGGRPKERQYYCDGVADYRKMRAAPAFATGLARLDAGSRRFRLAIMCSEQNPLECHRCLLVGRALHEAGRPVVHLLHDGSSMTQADVEERLLDLGGKQGADLFAPRQEQIAEAYWMQNRGHAFAEPQAADGRGIDNSIPPGATRNMPRNQE
jgi:uncharacterized protein (DUF488 family)